MADDNDNKNYIKRAAKARLGTTSTSNTLGKKKALREGKYNNNTVTSHNTGGAFAGSKGVNPMNRAPKNRVSAKTAKRLST